MISGFTRDVVVNSTQEGGASQVEPVEPRVVVPKLLTSRVIPCPPWFYIGLEHLLMEKI